MHACVAYIVHSDRVMTLSTRSLACALSVLLLASVACESPFGPMRVTTFPPDLSYLPPEQVRTAMWVLAAELQYLEERLNLPAASDQRFRKSEVLKSLGRMRVAADALDKPGRTSQHSILNENLERFVHRIERAERAVDRDPPNYFPASTIAGSCYLCHGKTHGTVMWREAAVASDG